MFVSLWRDTKAARRFFQKAIGAIKVAPTEVITDKAATDPLVLEALLPGSAVEAPINRRVAVEFAGLALAPAASNP